MKQPRPLERQSSANSNGAKNRRSLQLKFSNSSASLLHATPTSAHGLIASRSSAAIRLHRTRLLGISNRLTLCLLLGLALGLAWSIGFYHISPALLVLLGVASIAVGMGRWQQVVERAELEAELRVQQKLRTHVPGETAEWINLAINRWWTACNATVLMFFQDYVEPLLKDVLPPGIDKVEVVAVDLGGQTPSISNVKLADFPSSRAMPNDNTSSVTMVATFDLTVPSPDSRIVLRARVGKKCIGSTHLVYVDSLYIRGTLQAVLVINNQLPFPHVAKITATFTHKPDVWFSVKVLKGLKVTNIPFLKSWIHWFVMDMFTTLLVDPGKLILNIDPSLHVCGESDDGSDGNAEGVLTVRLTGRPPDSCMHKSKGTGGRWITLRVGNKKYRWPLSTKQEVWRATYSFLVHDLKQDVLVLKVKLHRLLYGNTLAVHSLGLHSLKLVNEKGEESQDTRCITLDNSETKLSLVISYTPLPSFSTRIPNAFPPLRPQDRCGVLYVHVHSGLDLLAADCDGLSDPYCVVMANKQKILHTHYVPKTLTPSWEKGVEVFVSDMAQVVLKFVVFDWDGPLVGDDLLGIAKLPLSMDSTEFLHCTLSLAAGEGLKEKAGSHQGSITVSVVFRLVLSVGEANSDCHITSLPEQQDDCVLERSELVLSGTKPDRKSLGKHLKNNSRRGNKESEDHMISSVLELQVLRGCNLVPKDSNGLSDPYVLVKYGSHTMFRSRVIKKTLNPEWEESATLSAPSTYDIIYVECWDKDIFSDDFMGSIALTHKDLDTFSGGARWCKLEHVKHGQLLLRLSLTPGWGGGGGEEETVEEVKWSHLDEASRQLVGQVELRNIPAAAVMEDYNTMDDPSCGSCASLQSSGTRDLSSEASLSHNSNTLGMATHLRTTQISFSPRRDDNTSSSEILASQALLKQRHTLGHQHTHSSSSSLDVSRKHENTTDIEWALKRGEEGVGLRSWTRSLDRTAQREKFIAEYQHVSGQVMEATGLKGDLDHLELYVKVRLNSRPSYQRQHKFGRGPLVHKTRVLRGSHSPQWHEDFVVKESPIPSDSLLTLDLKSGSKVNIGTYAITLDKFLDGSPKATRAFDIGNDVKLKVKLSRQLH